MGLFTRSMFRSLAIGFAVGAIAVASASGLARLGDVVPSAVAAPVVPQH